MLASECCTVIQAQRFLSFIIYPLSFLQEAGEPAYALVDLLRGDGAERQAHKALAIGCRPLVRVCEERLPWGQDQANRLGALNHTLLTIDSIRANGLECAGIVLNHTAPEQSDPATVTNRGILEEVSGVPILEEVAFKA